MRRATFTFSLCLALASLAVVSSAFAGTYTLHPSGFGELSYAAWKAQEGLPDSTGQKDQALYFQKMTPTATFAAGVAVIKGFEGEPVANLGELAFYWRRDGHCGAGAPRFNVRVEIAPGVRQTLFFGCNSGMTPDGMVVDDEGNMWERRRVSGSDLSLIQGRVVSLTIVHDEGIEFPPGYVYLDNIQVGSQIWRSASDNGNSGGGNDGPATVPAQSLMTEPLNVVFARPRLGL